MPMSGPNETQATLVYIPSRPQDHLNSDQPISSYTLKKRPWRRYVTSFEAIASRHYPGSGTEEDPFIVDWLPEDPEDPQRWSTFYKWFNIAVASFATLAVALSSSAYSGGIDSLIADFGASPELLTAGISLFVLGFAFGPLVWAPLSEVYGRRPIYIISYAFLTLWTAASAGSKTVAQLLVFRFLSGLFGSSPLANAGGTVSDVLNANQRGLGLSLFAAAPFLGPALGPITGGFLGLKVGWQWVEGFLAIFCGVIFIILIFFASETYASSLLRKRADLLSKLTGRVYRFRADAKKPLDIAAVFKAALLRPWKFLLFEPIVLILSIYIAVIYGILYLNFSAYPIIFQELRGWNTGVGGLAFLGILVGVFISILLSVASFQFVMSSCGAYPLPYQFYINPQYIKTAKKRGGRATPEDRLPPAIWGGFLVVIGLGGFAATDGPNIPWIAPILFGIPFGTGVIVVFMSVLGYLIDSYTIYAASVLAANSVLRSLFGAGFPLFTTYMYDSLGIHWAAALPGFIALALIPFTVLFYKYGATIRARCKYASDAERQMAEIMAAREAQKKTDEEDNLTSHGNQKKEPTGSVGNSKKALQAQPVEQEGGMGTIEQDISNEELGANPNQRSPTPRNKQDVTVRNKQEGLDGQPETETNDQLPTSPKTSYHDWVAYEALADRDESDLTWDERMRLEQFHRRFNYAMAMPGASYGSIPLPESDIGTITRSSTRVSRDGGMRGGAGRTSSEAQRSPSFSHLPPTFRLGQPV